MDNEAKIQENLRLLERLETAEEEPDSGWATARLIAGLRAMYAAPEYAFMLEVPDGTGARKSRTCDAMAMSVWPSRGLHLSGFEIKASRYDWLHEKRTPEKAEALAAYCDFWYLVVGGLDLLQTGELPATWGLIAPSKGGKLRVFKAAEKLEPRPIDRSFLAALMRAAVNNLIDKSEIQEAVRAAREEGIKRGKQDARYEIERFKDEAERLRRQQDEFEKASGLRINAGWNGAAASGRALRFVLDGGLEKQAGLLKNIRATAESVIRAIDGLEE